MAKIKLTVIKSKSTKEVDKISLAFVQSEFFSGFFIILIQTYGMHKNPVA